MDQNLLDLTQLVVEKVVSNHKITDLELLRLQRKFVKNNHAKQPFYTKSEILTAVKSEWRQIISKLEFNESLILDEVYIKLLETLKVKPIRTQSGVATVTVLTKPWACPGQCIFCPADVRMPKSYLANEPGAQRAELNFFDPYLQIWTRLASLQAMGHNLDKVEMIILGGTWDNYPLTYQIWFIKRVFEALNDFPDLNQSEEIKKYYLDLNEKLKNKQEIYLSNDPQENEQNWQDWQKKIDSGEISYNELIQECYLKNSREVFLAQKQQASWEELVSQQETNQKSQVRNVGLVIETRPDLITEQNLIKLRKLGCTKIQIGIQSLNDEILRKNKRGITREQIAKSFALLRQFGFKIHAHFMANLYGSNPELDIMDFKELVTNPAFLPDEIKLYPCSLIQSAPLVSYYKKNLWRPYEEDELLNVLVNNLKVTPSYVRITRMIRDFSSNDIIVGNKKTNFRQMVDQELQKQKIKVLEIRSREIRGKIVALTDLKLELVNYQTSTSQEKFFQWVTSDNLIAGFLRLSLPNNSKIAMIREVHVYGVVSNLGEKGQSQHLGLGTKLLQAAECEARKMNYEQIKVISAVGTREYYAKLGFQQGELYQEKNLLILSDLNA